MRHLILLLSLLCVPLSSHAIRTVGNGGVDLAFQVRQALKRAVHNSRDLLGSHPRTKDIDFSQYVASTAILLTTEPQFVEINGIKQECVGKNYSDPRFIVINIGKWQEITDGKYQEAVMLHEILGVAEVEKTGDYTVSDLYFDLPIHTNVTAEAKPSIEKVKAPPSPICNKLRAQAARIDDQLDDVALTGLAYAGDLNARQILSPKWDHLVRQRVSLYNRYKKSCR